MTRTAHGHRATGCGRPCVREGTPRRRGAARLLRWSLLAVIGGAAYMLFESQWLRRDERPLPVAGLPPALRGLTILHLSDVHAGQPGFNLWTFERAVRWAEERRPDLVVLTGDVLGGRTGWDRCLSLLARLRAPLGVYAVTGNHEYGLSKNPMTYMPEPIPWESAGVRLLRDECVTVEVLPRVDGPPTDPPRGPGSPATLTICGADYVTGGAPLLDAPPDGSGPALLLVHRPPAGDDPLAEHFALAFAGHTHGGQIRLPTPWGLRSPHDEGLSAIEGEHPWGRGRLVISRGIGTTFLPFRLLTRPQAVIFRLEDAGEDIGESTDRGPGAASAGRSGIYGHVGGPTDAGGGAHAQG